MQHDAYVTAALGRTFMVLPPMDNKIVCRGAPKKNPSDIKSRVRFSGMANFFLLIHGPGIKIRHTILFTKVVFHRLEDGRMVVAGGRPNAAVDCAVARCQFRYHAPFFTDTLPLFHRTLCPCFMRNNQIVLH